MSRCTSRHTATNRPPGIGRDWARAGAAVLCGAVALGAATPRAAHAQGVLPATGVDVRLGDLRKQFERAFQTQPSAAVPGWTFTPAIDVVGAWTDSVRPTAGTGQKADFYTTISPSLAIQGEGPRVSGSLFIAPQFRHYLSTPSQNSTSLNFNGQSHITLVPETLFLDLRGSAATQSLAGGVGPNSTVSLGRQDEVQTTNLSASPYLQHRFGGFGLGEIGYSVTRSTVNTASRAVSSPFLPPVSNQSILTTSAHAGFTSGEDFGRINFGGQLRRTDNHGTGTLNGAHRYTETVTLGYAVTRSVRVMGSIGHEDIRYASTTPYHVNGLTWNAGVQLTPNPDSTITIGYGRHDGGTSASLDASYALTARLRLSAQYSEGLTSGQEDLQQALLNSDVDATGQSVDHRTGVPLVTDNFFGTQTSPARVKRLSIMATLLHDRDVFTFNIRRDESHYLPTTSGTVLPGTSSTGISTGFGWQHDFSPALHSNVYLQYGTRDSSGRAGAGSGTISQQTVAASLGVTYQFTETLSGRAQYSYSGSFGGSSAISPSYAQNLILVGLRKTF